MTTIEEKKTEAACCRYGHAFDEKNTYINPKGGQRQCRVCNGIRAAIYKGLRSPQVIDTLHATGEKATGLTAEQVELMIAAALVSPRSTTIDVQKWDGTKVNVGSAHRLFAKLLYYVSRRRHTYLFGPMGSGKSHAAAQCAKALDLRYAYVSLNPQSPASLLNGFIDAQGRFASTEFYRCYTEGGVFCIDELDNASASLLTTLNSALANGHASFPNGMQARHADFVLIATGNTTGRGGDWQYPERRKIDEATMDRLTTIAWDYDESLESDIALQINPSCGPWMDWVRTVRVYVAKRENGIRGGVYATPRSVFAGAEDLAYAPVDIDVATIADSTVFKGLDNDTRARVLSACPLPAYSR